MGKELIIKISHNRIYFNPFLSIPIEQTNIPSNEYMTFRSSDDIFWTVEMKGYDEKDKCLQVAVIEYRILDLPRFNNQTPKKEVQRLQFEKFNWLLLQTQLSYFQKSKFKDMLIEEEEMEDSDDDAVSESGQFPFNSQSLMDTFKFSTNEPAEKKQVVKNISEEFWINFNEAQFKLGYVTVKKYIKGLGKEVEFKIANEHILAEFDNIKFWFAKKLQAKRFQVSVRITITDNEITDTTASSNLIDQITPALIESIKFQRTIALTKELKLTSPDKTLFTADEMFSQINSEDIEGNVFNQSEQDILTILSEQTGIRNKKQLDYLSRIKQSENHKLRYTQSLILGFCFW